jgi:choline dehydrogenase
MGRALKRAGDIATHDADYVIVGGGTAGCVLANRLSADPSCRVVVVEAGDADRSPWIAMPAGVAKLFHHPRLNWRYRTQPEPGLGGRRLYWPRGKVLGGTSSINGMTYTRGQHADYDAWRAIAGDLWSWSRVLPYFQRIEDRPFGTPGLCGRGGPLRIGRVESPPAVAEAFLRASVAAGIPRNDDYNGATQEGIGYSQVMMRDGIRSSAASAYLAPARSRANLRVLTNALVRRVVLDDGRATGIEIEQGGRIGTIAARREVLLCAGTVASPQLLMLSGIGDARALQALGIRVHADRPQVGRNLQEHVRAQLVHRLRIPSLNDEARGLRLARHALDYALFRRGLLTSTASQVNGFVRSAPDVARPDLQIVFRASSGDYRDTRFVFHDFAGVMSMVGLIRPRSRGSITLAGADPRTQPAIIAGHLTDPADCVPLIAGIGRVREIFATEPMAHLVDREVRPGPGIVGDEALRGYLVNTADSLYHATGTCAMGTSADCVTTPQLEVRGVANLRVVDASVMPGIPSGNTTAAVLMIAERAAEWIALRAKAVTAT